MAKPQPAKVSYFFGKGYTDLWNTIKESWSRNIHTIFCFIISVIVKISTSSVYEMR